VLSFHNATLLSPSWSPVVLQQLVNPHSGLALRITSLNVVKLKPSGGNCAGFREDLSMFHFSSDMKEYLRLLRDGSMRIEMSAAQLPQLDWL
jgi:hypothetical protein